MAAETCAFPVSFAQQRVWFLTQLAPESPYYNIGAGVPLGTPIDRELLSRCLDELVRRHESLRTAICTVDGSPMQLVGPPYRISLPVVDLRALPEALRRAEVRRILALALRDWSGSETRTGSTWRGTVANRSSMTSMCLEQSGSSPAFIQCCWPRVRVTLVER